MEEQMHTRVCVSEHCCSRKSATNILRLYAYVHIFYLFIKWNVFPYMYIRAHLCMQLALIEEPIGTLCTLNFSWVL